MTARRRCSAPLFGAAQNGHEKIARALIKAGADVNKTNDNGVTPLFNAAENGHATIVQILTDAGAA
jgi:ankyrin repeat protein